MKIWTKLMSAAIVLAAISTVNAQQQGGPPGGGDPNGGFGGGGGGGGGGFGGGPGGGGPDAGDGGPPNPEEMRARMGDRVKQALGTTDDAWATLQPLVEKVQELEHELDSGPRQHGPPRREDDNNADQNGEGPPQSSIEAAVSNLKKVLADKSAPDGKIEDSMKAVEDAEKKTRDDLVEAQKELKAAVSLRQQAVLVALGVLN